MAITRDEAIEIDVTDPTGFALIVVTAQRSGFAQEVVYANGAFSSGYTAAPNATAVITDGLRFTLRRDTWWPLGTLLIRVYAVDADGNLATSTETYSVEDAEAAGEVVPIDPATTPIGDFALAFDGAELDMGLVDDDVEAELGLRTAVILSLFTDRRAEDDDDLPGAPDDRRGWWADELAEVAGDKMGSRLWLLERGTNAADVVPRAEEYAREALQWLIEDKVAERVEVTAEVIPGRLGLAVTIYRPDGEAVSYRFAHAWTGEAARAVTP